jgi:dihydrofolate synthase/folylpolyglutamate synthase
MPKPIAKQAPTRKRAKGTVAKKPAKVTGRSTAVRTYHSAVTFLNSRVNYERMLRPGYTHAHFNLSRMLRLLAQLGNPHKELDAIHIAGTKGKGSTCHMVAAMLQQAGYKVGLYTSPHFIELRERIVINGQMISEAEFARQMARVARVVKRLEKDGPTYFDILTAVALLHFRDQKVDYVVLETGLGGRLDSTNVCKPIACGITSISFDHMAQLGPTLEKIAEEKAGIFKPGVTVISAPQPTSVKKVLRAAAERVGCKLRILGDDIEFSHRFESSRTSGPQNRVCMTTPTTCFDHLHVPLLGEHQAHNCGVALGIIDALREDGLDVTTQDAIDGLGKVRVQGRLETIRDLPLTVVDAAHNAASIAALMRSLGQNFNYDSMVVIFGCAADKDIDGMLNQLRLGADKVIFTNISNPRSADPYELHARFQEMTQKMAQVAPTLTEAYRIATNCVSRDDLICVTGSIYLVGLAKQQLVGPQAVI